MLSELNAVLAKHGLAVLDDEEWAPLRRDLLNSAHKRQAPRHRGAFRPHLPCCAGAQCGLCIAITLGFERRLPA
jgi:hypothetical protein